MAPRRWPLLCGFPAVLVHFSILTAGQRPPERPPRPAGWSPAPSSSWAPTPEPAAPADGEGSAAALAFLRTGDVQRLARANCSGAVAAAAAPGAGPPPAVRTALRAAPEALAHAANFLNMLFQTNDIREASVAEDVEWYQALVRSLAEGHPWVRRAVLALDAHPLAPKPRLMLQATKGDGQLLLQDVSGAAPSLGNLSWDNEWFNALKSQRLPALRKRVLSNDLRSLETPKWQRGDSYVGDAGHVRWSPPFLECREGRFVPTWVVTLSSAFYGLKPDLSPEFKGVVRVDVELRDVAIDQCSSGPGWFSDTHRCDLNSTQESRGFVLGRYLCRCKPGFYRAGGAASGAWAGPPGTDGGSHLGCRPCRPGCPTCEDDTPCLIQEDQVLRAAVLSCQACCMLAIFLSMLVSYHFRRSKRIRTSGIILLETILFGSLLLYFPVFILYFKPSIFRCIVLRWVRMLGFAIVYGTITLKLYRVLKLFLSRSAPRSAPVSSPRVLRLLAPMLLLVLWFLAAWTIGMLQNSRRNIPLVIGARTARGQRFSICGHDCWDYMMVIAEMLFLLWGSFLCFATRAVPSAFHEPRYMGIALHNELLLSSAFHLVRFLIVPSLHPDWTLLLFFAHTHGTITMTLALLFIPKFLHSGSPLREEITAEVYEDELDMRRSGSCLNSSIASAWSERSLDPDDIREELKKLYRQLEAHKTWRMATNNPHLPRKRSSRRSLVRSILRRGGAELAEPLSRRSSAGDRAGTLSRRSSSAKRLGDGIPRVRDDSSRRRSSAPRKSRSSEGQPRDSRPGSRSPSPPEEPREVAEVTEVTEVTEVEPSDSDSLDAAPLVCRSASAQNLAGSWRRPPGRAPPLQKSHSVVTGAREVALLAARTAARDGWHGSRHLSAPGLPEGTATAPSPGRGDSPGDTAPPGEAKGHKHVTYAPIKSVSVDSAHPPRRVRVTVRKTPPPPPVRYQSLQRSGTLGDSTEPPPEPPAQAGQAEGTAGDTASRASPPGKARRLTPSASSAHVCPWELIQDEILSRRQKAAEAAADSGTPGDTAATTPGPKAPPQKSFRSLGLAIKALNRSRGKSILKGRRESEGSLRKRGSGRREKPSPAEESLGGLGAEPTARSPQGSGKSPESPALQQNNNAAMPGEAAGWGDSRTDGQGDSLAEGTLHGDKAAEEPSAGWGDSRTDGQGDSLAEGTLHGDKAAEEPSAGWGDRGTGLEDSLAEGTLHGDKAAEEPSAARQHADADGGLKPPSEGHQGCRPESPEVARAQPREGDEAPAVDVGKDIPAATADQGTPDRLEATRRSPQPWEHREKEQRPPSSVRGAAGEKVWPPGDKVWPPGDKVWPPGWLGMPAGRAALLRQEAIAPREDGAIPDSSDTAPGRSWSEEGAQGELRAAGGSASEPEIIPGEQPEGSASGTGGQEGHPQRSPGGEKPSELHEVSPERAEGSRAEVCSWESREQGRSVPAEICPWDTEGTPEGTPERQGFPKTREGEELAGKSPAVPKSSSRQVGTAESKKANICPWEVQEEPRPKSEICPWEEAAAPPGKERLSQDTRGTSKGGEKVGFRALEKGKQPLGKPQTGSSALPKATSGKSLSSEKAEICPWEDQEVESTDKGEICPWEVAEPHLEKGKAPGKEKLPPKEVTKALEKGSRDRESICPWESLDTELPPAKPQSGSSALPKAPSGKSQSSEMAEICPWEAQDVKSAAKSEICPWEVAEPQLEKGKSAGKEKLPGKETSKPLEKSSKDWESICPWESLDTEEPPGKPQTGSSALPKAPSGKSQSSESMKAEICPWESQDVKSTAKAEICPWEVAEPQLEKETAPGKKRIPEKEVSKSLDKGSKDKESICPWESLDTGQPPGKSQTGSSALPKAPSGKSQSLEKSEICPWEAQEPKSASKAEICPWEVAEPQLEKGTLPGKERIPRKEASKALEKSSKDWESICPWESLDTEQLSPKTPPGKEPSRKSDSTESRKSEICPWEVAEPPSQQPKAKQIPPGSSKGDKPLTRQAALASPERSLDKGSSKDRVSICPWESLDTEQPLGKPQTGSSALPKAPSGKSQSSEKAEICPWEAQDVKSNDKSEICPWEVAEPQLEKGTSPGKKKLPGKEVTKPLDKGSKDRESICPWESLDTEQLSLKTPPGKEQSKKSDSTESRKSEICPWEVAEPQLEKGKAPGKLPQKEASKPLDKGSKDRASICPWESLDTEQLSPKTPPGKDPSKKSESTESRKSEICPWEVAEPPSQQPKAKQVPPGSSKGDKPLTRQAALASPERSLDKGSSKDRESICPWESLDTQQPPGKPQSGSSALPKAPSGKSQSSEKAEICPWEAQDVKSSDKSEICPWEVAEPQLDKGTSPGKERIPGKESSKALEKSSKDRESICPWESLDTEQLSPKTPPGKDPSKKSESTDSRKSEICPWEVAEPPSQQPKAKQIPPGSSKGDKPLTRQAALASPERSLDKGSSRDRESICPWESLDTEQPLGKPQTGSSALPKAPSGKSQSSEKAEICPWEAQEPKSSDKAEICPWEVAEPQQERGTSPGKERIPPNEVTKALEKGSKDRESICPWESLDTEQPLGKPQTGSSALPKAPSEKSQSSEKAEICPWESQDVKSTAKGEIRPWEVAEPQLEKGTLPGKERIPGKETSKPLDKGSKDRVSICPWESLDTGQPPAKPQSGSSALPKAPSGKSQSSEKSEICPWESQEPKSSDKSEICPWEVAEPQLEKGTLPGMEKLPGKEVTKPLEKGSKDRESICPWESLDTEHPPAKPQTGSSALPKAPSGKSQSSEKAEICPWEVQESKSSDKSEICPWEVTEPQLEKGKSAGKEKLPPKEVTKALEKGSKDRESICPWESLDTEQFSLKTPPGKDPSKKSESTESRKSEICPWEATEPSGSEQQSSQAGLHPRGSHRASPAGMAEPGAGTGTALLEKSKGRSQAEHKPLCRLLPTVQQPVMGSRASPGPGLAEVCPWEAGEDPAVSAEASMDTGRSSEVCPWEEESMDVTRSCPGSDRDGDGDGE